MSRIPLLLEKAIEHRLFTLIYGPSGSGKTILASHVARRARERGYRVSYVYVGSHNMPATPEASTIDARVEAYTLDDLLYKVSLPALSGHYVIVDPINSFYTEHAGRPALRVISFLAALMRRCGGLAIGVAREAEDGVIVTPAWHTLTLYAHIVATTYKHSDRFRLVFLKPEKRIASFRIVDGRLEWL